MAANFPSSPTNGQTFTVGSRVFTWDGAAWSGTVSSDAPVTANSDTVLSNKTLNGVELTGSITTPSYPLTGTVIDPANGVFQSKTLSGNTTFTHSVLDGQDVLLVIDNSGGYTIAYPGSIVWLEGSPVLGANGMIYLWSIGGTTYGSWRSRF